MAKSRAAPSGDLFPSNKEGAYSAPSGPLAGSPTIASAPLPASTTYPTRADRADRKEFFLPVLGFAWLYPEERDITNHPAFQRLSKINQLGQTYFVFRGATHKRIEHVLGATHVAGRMIKATWYNCKKRAERDLRVAAPLNDAEERFVRLGALLHDIGHLAAGHTLEDELCLIGKHDEDDRIKKIFSKRNWFEGDEFPELGKLINELYADYVPKTLKQKCVTAGQICHLLIRKTPKGDQKDRKPPKNDQKDGRKEPYENIPLKEALEHISQSHEIRLHLCSNIIGNTICADLLDYLYRDWYHIGKIRSIDERIFQYMEVRSKSDLGLEPVMEKLGDYTAPRRPDDVFVIALGDGPKDLNRRGLCDPRIVRVAVRTGGYRAVSPYESRSSRHDGSCVFRYFRRVA